MSSVPKQLLTKAITFQARAIFFASHGPWYMPLLRTDAARALTSVQACEEAGQHAAAEIWLAALRATADRDRRLERAAQRGADVSRYGITT